MTGTEKQIAAASRVRTEALKRLDEFRAIFADSTSFYGKNMLAIYNAGYNIIMSFEDAGAILSGANDVAQETMAFAAKWEQHYNYCKQHGAKPHSARMIMKYATPSDINCKYLNADAFEQEAQK